MHHRKFDDSPCPDNDFFECRFILNGEIKHIDDIGRFFSDMQDRGVHVVCSRIVQEGKDVTIPVILMTNPD